MPLNNGQATTKPKLLDAFKALQDCINYNLNCVKVARVIEFNPTNLTVKCRVNNKRLVGLKEDGNQILKEYPVIYAKVHFFGWGNIGAIYPIEAGMDGILLFNDRELETWFTTSENGNLAYDRCHDLTDALFICGVHSSLNIPLVPFIEECLHIYYKSSDFQIKDKSITSNTTDNTLNCDTDTINTKDFILKSTNNEVTSTSTKITSSTIQIIGNTTQTGTVTTSGVTTSGGLVDTTAATGTFISADGKTISVVNGIVKTII